MRRFVLGPLALFELWCHYHVTSCVFVPSCHWLFVSRRSRGDTSFKNLMQGRSVISRRESQENILQRESTVKEISRSEKHYLNAVYDEHYRDASDEESNEFMVEVNLGKKTRKTPALPTEVRHAASDLSSGPGFQSLVYPAGQGATHTNSSAPTPVL